MTRSALVALVSLLGATPPARIAHAQDLTPRAYVVTPLRTSAVLVTDVFNQGDLNFEGAVPIEDATGTINGLALGFYHSLAVFGRSANVNLVLPYGTGAFEGLVLGEPYSTDRSGLFDIPIRLAVNLAGGPALTPAEWVKWRQKLAHRYDGIDPADDAPIRQTGVRGRSLRSFRRRLLHPVRGLAVLLDRRRQVGPCSLPRCIIRRPPTTIPRGPS